jgi:hypothetical protein
MNPDSEKVILAILCAIVFIAICGLILPFLPLEIPP